MFLKIQLTYSLPFMKVLDHNCTHCIILNLLLTYSNHKERTRLGWRDAETQGWSNNDLYTINPRAIGLNYIPPYPLINVQTDVSANQQVSATCGRRIDEKYSSIDKSNSQYRRNGGQEYHTLYNCAAHIKYDMTEVTNIYQKHIKYIDKNTFVFVAE